MPFEDETDHAQTLGFCFIEYEDAKSTEVAISVYNHHQLDRSHILSVQTMEKMLCKKISENHNLSHIENSEYIQYSKVYGTRFNRKLLNNNGNDQFLVYTENKLLIFSNNRRECTADIQYCKENIHNTYACWSTNGNYLATTDGSVMTLIGDEDIQKLSNNQLADLLGVKCPSNTKLPIV
jgi:hypothetical protein